MRIVVTGGTGDMGKAVIDVLADAGHEITVLGRRLDLVLERAAYHAGDVRDPVWLRQCMAGHDAVVHLAAVARPSLAPAAELFSVNALGTFSVYQTAAELGIRRVVQASSVNAIGLFFSTDEPSLHYLPIDEQHSSRTTDPYSFSKTVIESIGQYFWRRDHVSGVTLRLPWVTPCLPDGLQVRQRVILEKMQTLSPEARRIFLTEHLDCYAQWRAERRLEHPDDFEATWSNDSPLSPVTRDLVNGRYNLFTAIHDQDAAEAIRCAVEGTYEGAHTVFLTDDRNWLGCPSAQLAEVFYPDVPVPRALKDDEALIDCQKARQLLAWQPRHNLADLG